LKQQLKQRWLGERSPYTGSLSRATVWFRIGSSVVALVLVTVVLTLAGFHPIQRVRDEIGHVRGSGKLAGLSAIAQPSGSPTAQSAPWAVDNVRDRGWTTAWASDNSGDPKAACTDVPAGGAPSTGVTSTALLVNFPSAVDVREIGFEPGLTKPAERNNRWQPRTLELRWSGGTCQPVNLENSPGLQRFRVTQKSPVTGVTIIVIAGYPPVDPGPGQLDVGEVTVWKR
jgi:hypothetical protein